MALMTSFLPSLLLFFLLSLNTTHLICHASDSITPAEPLSGTRSITSEGGRFELGFFQPSNSSQRYYMGIWFKQIPEKTVVWVANREIPLPNTTNSLLKITADGNLHLLSPSNVSVWSTNLTSTAPSNSTVAVLLESGNFVLRDGTDPSVIHWQSFDYTTDTLLPGNWIGRNKVTGLNKGLTAWKSKEDPAPGPFSMEVDPNQNQYWILWNRTRPYWTTGVWDGKVFSGMPEMAQHFRSELTFVDNQTGTYFAYTVYDPSTLSYNVLDVSGQVKTFFLGQGSNQFGGLYWYRPKNQCDVYALCGNFGSCNELSNPYYCSCLPGFTPTVQKNWELRSWSDGCMRRTPLHLAVENSTSNVERDRFRALPAMKLPENSEFLPARSAAECKLACLNRPSCTAYAFDNRCLMWNGDLVNGHQLSRGDASGRTLFLRLAASEVPIPKSRKGMIAGIVVGSVVGLALVLGLVLFVIRRYQRQRKAKLRETLARGSLVGFSYRDLQSATKNFSEILGRGGFGSVFKGTLPDLTMVAVKKLQGISQGEKQFRSEVSTIGTIQHVNLIRLRGFCSEGNNKLLVYEYMPNGSLDSHLFGGAKYLDWSRRYQIAIETARGLDYLHEKCRDCIIHCDIKPENILLDDEFCVKIADFGLAKLFGHDFSHVITTMRGTIGYLAPEWISGVAISSKADVYSYGMMLFEIISGRRNKEDSVEGQTKFFPVWGMGRMLEGDVESLLDDRLVGNSNMEEVHRACRVAGWCIQDLEKDRPSMGQIVQILEGVLEVSVPPIPRLLQALEENCNKISSVNLPSTPSDLSSAVPSQIKSLSSSTSSRADHG